MRQIAAQQPISLRRLDGLMLVLGAALLGIVANPSLVSAADVGESLTRNTIRVALAWYFGSLILMSRLHSGDWTATTPSGRLARWCWTWGLAWFLIHVGIAFHYYHHWSHADAFERTRRISGVGEGIDVSYLFGLVWTADAVAWWLAPARYAARPAWINRALHGFMLFTVFNGMVVFESGVIRAAGIAMFIALPLVWLISKRH